MCRMPVASATSAMFAKSAVMFRTSAAMSAKPVRNIVKICATIASIAAPTVRRSVARHSARTSAISSSAPVSASRPNYYGQRYVVNNYRNYRLPTPGARQQWVRHYNDMLLVNARNGTVDPRDPQFLLVSPFASRITARPSLARAVGGF